MLGNTPMQTYDFHVESGLSFAFTMKFWLSDGTPFDVTDAPVRLTIAQPPRKSGPVVYLGEAVPFESESNAVQFQLQAGDLDLAVAEYPYSIVLQDINDYSVPVMKGVFNVSDNADIFTENSYTFADPGEWLDVQIHNGSSVNVTIKHVGDGGGDLSAHIADVTDAHAARAISFTAPGYSLYYGTTTVEGALLNTGIAVENLFAHLTDTTDAHAAASISVDASDFGGTLNSSVTNVQLLAEAVDELNAGFDAGPSGYTDIYSDIYVGVDAPSSGVSDHGDLDGLTEPDAHPITSITGLEDALQELEDAIGEAVVGDHHHDSRYYTESEIDSMLSGIITDDTGYSEAEVDSLLAGYSLDGHTHGGLSAVAADWSPSATYGKGALVMKDGCVWMATENGVHGLRREVERRNEKCFEVTGSGSGQLEAGDFSGLQVGDVILGIVAYTGEGASPGWTVPSNTAQIGRVTKYDGASNHSGIVSFYVRITSPNSIPGGSNTIVINRGSGLSADTWAARAQFYHLRGMANPPVFNELHTNTVPTDEAIALNNMTQFGSGADYFAFYAAAASVGIKTRATAFNADDRVWGTANGNPNMDYRVRGNTGRVSNSYANGQRLVAGFATKTQAGSPQPISTLETSGSTSIIGDAYALGMFVRCDPDSTAVTPFFDEKKWKLLSPIEHYTGQAITDRYAVFGTGRLHQDVNNIPRLFIQPNRTYDLVVPADFATSTYLVRYGIVDTAHNRVWNRVKLSQAVGVNPTWDNVKPSNTPSTAPVFADGQSSPFVDFDKYGRGGTITYGYNENNQMVVTGWSGDVVHREFVHGRTTSPVHWIYGRAFTDPALISDIQNAAERAEASKTGFDFMPPNARNLAVLDPLTVVLSTQPIPSGAFYDNITNVGASITWAGILDATPPYQNIIEMGNEFVTPSGRFGAGNVFQHEYGHYVDFRWMYNRSAVAGVPANSRISSSTPYMTLFSEVAAGPGTVEPHHSPAEYFAEFYSLLCYPLTAGQTTADAVYLAKRATMLPGGVEPSAGWFDDMVQFYIDLGLGFTDIGYYP